MVIHLHAINGTQWHMADTKQHHYINLKQKQYLFIVSKLI